MKKCCGRQSSISNDNSCNRSYSYCNVTFTWREDVKLFYSNVNETVTKCIHFALRPRLLLFTNSIANIDERWNYLIVLFFGNFTAATWQDKKNIASHLITRESLVVELDVWIHVCLLASATQHKHAHTFPQMANPIISSVSHLVYSNWTHRVHTRFHSHSTMLRRYECVHRSLAVSSLLLIWISMWPNIMAFVFSKHVNMCSLVQKLINAYCTHSY